MSVKKFPEERINVRGQEIPYHKVDSDSNGNPRYVVHFLSLDIEPEDYGSIPNLNGSRYRAKWFGGGIVFQSYNLEEDLGYALDTVENFYNQKGEK